MVILKSSAVLLFCRTAMDKMCSMEWVITLLDLCESMHFYVPKSTFTFLLPVTLIFDTVI